MNKQELIKHREEVLYYFPNFEEQSNEIKNYMVKIINCFLKKEDKKK